MLASRCLCAARKRWAAGVLLAAPLIACPAASLAADVEVSSTTAAQGYSLRSPYGDPVLSRRRFMQTLGLVVRGIEGEDRKPGGPEITVRIRMRLDADFGLGWGEYHDWTPPNRFVPGLQQAPFDLMYGYVDMRRLAGGVLDVRLGRQYVIDPLGWWSFDGAMIRSQLPFKVALESYTGFEQRGGLALSTPRFERDGVWRGDRTGLEASYYPEFLSSGYAPAWGGAVETWGTKHFNLRASYRKVWSSAPATTRMTALATGEVPQEWTGMRTSTERLGASGNLYFDDLGDLRAGAVYDVYSSLFSSYYATLDLFPARWLTVGSDADRFVPTFDADSIFNWFSHNPMTTWTGRAELAVSRAVDASVSGGVRWVETSMDPEGDESGGRSHLTDVIGRAGLRHRAGAGAAGASAMLERGERGHRQGIDLFANRLLQERWHVLARTSLYDWKDELRPDRSATSFGYVLGGGYRPGPLTQVMLEWEHNTNRLVGQRFRVMVWLQMMVTR